MLTGLGYILAGVVSPVSLLTTSFSAGELAISVVRHQAMWLCGLLIFLNVGKFRMRDVDSAYRHRAYDRFFHARVLRAGVSRL